MLRRFELNEICRGNILFGFQCRIFLIMIVNDNVYQNGIFDVSIIKDEQSIIT